MVYDLFLDPKVLDYDADRYELILYTLRRARTLKGKGAPEPMQELIERALKEIVEKKITKEEIMNTAAPAAPTTVAEEVPIVVSLADEESPKGRASAEDDDDKKKTKKKKK